MRKTLYLVRHAKSSWAFDLPDHDRPLGKRGRRDVISMGNHLKKNQPKPDTFISSTASRAFYTALHICDQLGVEEDRIDLSKNLYHAGPKEILEVVKAAPEGDVLAIFGHNPGFTLLANHLANMNIENIPTCGIVGISFDAHRWTDISFGSGKMEFFYQPKKI